MGCQLPVGQRGSGEGLEGTREKGQQAKDRRGDQAAYVCTSMKIHLTSSSTFMHEEGLREWGGAFHACLQKMKGNWTPGVPCSFPGNINQVPCAFKERLLQMDLSSSSLQMGLSSGSLRG